MTLSDTSVQKLLKDKFVTAWVNTEGDTEAGGSFAHSPSDGPGSCIRGNGRANLQILTLTPDGRIFHALAGFVSSTDLKAELTWALETLAMMKKTPTLEREMVAERARDYVSDGPQPTSDTKFGAQHQSIFQEHIERGVTRDARFLAKHPLLAIADFRTSMLGSGGAQFFGSASGSKPGETIGNVGSPTREMLDMTPDELRELAERNNRKAEHAKRLRRPRTAADDTPPRSEETRASRD